MNRRVLVCVSALALSCACVGRVHAQSEDGAQTAAAVLPGPFVEEESSPFLKGLRRFEIVSFGSFPITLLYTNWGFRIADYVRHGSYSEDSSDSATFRSVGIACALSVGIGVLDAVIRAIRGRETRNSSPRVDSP